MPYTPTVWVDGISAATAATMNNLETGIDAALGRRFTVRPTSGDFPVSSYGSADVAVTAAISAASAAGGGVVDIGPGSYVFAAVSDNTGKNNVTVRGAGRGATTISKVGGFAADSSLILFRDSTNTTVRDLTMVGYTSSTTTVNFGDQGLDFSDCTNINVHNCEFKDFGDAGLRIREDVFGSTLPATTAIATFSVIVSGNHFSNCHQTSTTPGGAQRYIFTNNILVGMKGGAKFGGRFANHARLVVTDNVVVNTTDASHTRIGIEMTIPNEAVIAGNVIRNSLIGIGIASNDAEVSTAVAGWGDVEIANNVITNAQRGIRFANEPNPTDSSLNLVQRVQIRGNMIQCAGGSDAAVHHGITIIGGLRDVTVANNSVNGAFASGIYAELVALASLSSSEDVDILDNVLRSNAQEGIEVIRRASSPTPDRFVKRVRIEGNTIRDGKGPRVLQVDGLTFRNNIVEGGTAGTLLDTIDNATVTQNRLVSTTASQYALELDDVDDGVVERNELVAGSGAAHSLKFDTNCSNLKASRNHITGGDFIRNGIIVGALDDLFEDWLGSTDGYTLPRAQGLSGTTTFTSGTGLITLLRCRRTFAATGLKLFCSTTFTGSTDMRAALYSFDFATRIGQSADLGNPTANTVISAAFAGGTVNVTADTWYWAVFVSVGVTAGAVRGLSLNASAFVPTVGGSAVGQAFTGYAGGNIAQPLGSRSTNAFMLMAELY